MTCYFEYTAKNKKNIFRKLYIKVLAKISRNSIFPFLRVVTLRLMGVTVGKAPFIGVETYVDDTVPELVQIGDNVTISFRVIIIAHKETGVRGEAIVDTVTIADRVFIGAGAIIMPGVTIGESAIIAAGAIVTKNVPNGVLIKGIY
jgi:acetyltransferase-like isoleucine patch superfamily enzyme